MVVTIMPKPAILEPSYKTLKHTFPRYYSKPKAECNKHNAKIKDNYNNSDSGKDNDDNGNTDTTTSNVNNKKQQ